MLIPDLLFDALCLPLSSYKNRPTKSFEQSVQMKNSNSRTGDLQHRPGFAAAHVPGHTIGAMRLGEGSLNNGIHVFRAQFLDRRWYAGRRIQTTDVLDECVSPFSNAHTVRAYVGHFGELGQTRETGGF